MSKTQNGGRPSSDYDIPVDMEKQICMIQLDLEIYTEITDEGKMLPIYYFPFTTNGECGGYASIDSKPTASFTKSLQIRRRKHRPFGFHTKGRKHIFSTIQENRHIRTEQLNNETYFVGKDVAEALGYERATKAIQDHVDLDDKDEVPIQDSIGRIWYRIGT